MKKISAASETAAMQEESTSKPQSNRFFSALPLLRVSFKNVFPRAFGQLAILGLLLLLLATALTAAVAMQQLRSIANQEGQARAQQVADSLAGRISRALSLGVPLLDLVGVPALFDQRMQQVPGITGLALMDLSSQPLWMQLPQQSAAQRAPQTLDKDAMAPPALPAGLSVSAPVYANSADAPTAQVVLVWQDLDKGSLWGTSLLTLVAWPLAVSVLAALALRRSLRRGRMRRSAAVQKASDLVLVGDYSQPLPLLRQHEFDLRPAWLSAQLRLVNEQHLRISRLHHSLRQTEPDAARRSDLDAALAFADANQHFRNPQGGPALAPLSPNKEQDPTPHAPKQGQTWKTSTEPLLHGAVRSAAGLCLFAGIVLPLLLAFAPQLLPATTWLIKAALVLSALGNGAWLAGIFIRSTAEPESGRQHHVA